MSRIRKCQIILSSLSERSSDASWYVVSNPISHFESAKNWHQNRRPFLFDFPNRISASDLFMPKAGNGEKQMKHA